MSGIVFQVETRRVLEILAKDIYDSPMALLRENVQNAYDAVRMRFARSGILETGGRIDVRLSGNRLAITDNGIGMSEEVLRGNFWKAGSSGKHSDAARRSGVVGTFGIGAMANFGVCDTLTVETRAEGSAVVLRSTAQKSSLRIGEECIALERVETTRDVGTTVTATLDAQHPITVAQARQYLEPYVWLLPVPVYLNEVSISCGSMATRPPISGRHFSTLGSRQLGDGICGGQFEVQADVNGQILVLASAITLAGNPVEGSAALLQAGGQLVGLRSCFGLAPIPAIGTYQLGGFANLSFLQPTAGREALSRESIEHVTRLVGFAEHAASEIIATTTWADKNT